MTSQGRRKTGTAKRDATKPRRTPASSLLSTLRPQEAAVVLAALLRQHLELHNEAETIARIAVTEVDTATVADEVVDAVLTPDLDDLNDRAERHANGYVSPTEAAWQLLQEQVEPFFVDLRRLIECGFESAAIATCRGIVVGLRRVGNAPVGPMLEWASDFPREAVAQALAILEQQSKALHSRVWTLPERDEDDSVG